MLDGEVEQFARGRVDPMRVLASRAESPVEPTRSQNITVSCRRSASLETAAALGVGDAAADG
jgi:hypothetical protein